MRLTQSVAPGQPGGRRLVVGIAKQDSIAYGCAVKLHACGADVAVTCFNDKAKKYVRPLAEQLGASLILPPGDTIHVDAGLHVMA